MKSITRFVSLFVIATFSLVNLAGASPAERNLTSANQAFTRTAKIAQKKAQIRVVTKSKELLSRRHVVSLASPTPEKPEVNFYFAGVDDRNNVLIGVDTVMTFAPVNPVRFFVNGYRTNKDVTAQTMIDASPGSPYGLEGNGVAEVHGVNIVLPGKIGFYGIESQIDWSKDYYFSSTYLHVVDHLGAIYRMCVNPNGDVSVVFIFDTFDQAFPASVEVTMNDIALKPVGPVAIEKEGFLTFVSMTLANEDYVKLQEDGNEYGAYFIVRGDNGVIIQWNDYLPYIQDLPRCSCYDPNTGAPVPCPWG